MAKEPSETHQLIWGSNPELTLCVPNNSPQSWHMEKSLLSMIQPTSPRKSAKVNVSKDSNAYGRQAGNVNE